MLALPLAGAYAPTQSNMAATLNVDWLIDLVAGVLATERLERPRRDLLLRLEALAAVTAPGQLVYHPYISEAGERGPFLDGAARAGFCGLSSRHGIADLMRAVYEGLGFAARDCYAGMGPAMPAEVRLCGGAARSPVLRGILAATLETPVRCSRREEAGAAGAAMIAAVGIGLYTDVEACAEQWVAPLLDDALTPDPDLAARYRTLVPAWRAARVAPNEAMAEQSRGVIGEGRAGLRNALVVIQVALSLLLVVAAGLFVRTFSALSGHDLGFDRDPVLIVAVNAQRSETLPADRWTLYERVREAAAALPGVASAAASVVTPISGSSWQYPIEIPERPDLPERNRGVYVNLVTPDWFTTYGTTLLAGRDFTALDRRGAPEVAIVNETLARRLLETTTPIGRRVLAGARPGQPNRTFEIVGFVRDAAYRSPRDPVPPTLYLSLAQHVDIPSSITISLRSNGVPPGALARSVSVAIAGVDRNLALTTRSLAVQVNAALIQERLLAMLGGFFGALALLLAGVGLYGVTSYAAGRRRTEMGHEWW